MGRYPSLAVAVGLLLMAVAGPPAIAAERLPPSAIRQIQAILADKARWTPVERKLATPVLMAHRRSRGRAMIQGVTLGARSAARARVDSRGMIVVDLRARVTEELLSTIEAVGGEVVSSHPALDAVRARVPIRRVDTLAELPEVRFVRPKARFRLNAGSETTEGDVAHEVAAARTTLSVDGSGVRICALSGGVNSLADRQATGDLPPTCASPPAPGPCVAVLSGQAGTDDWGTAMLEILHDLAPGAQLFFADSDGGEAQLATNIQTLHATYGCDVFVDDVTYPSESAFQDGPIAQATNGVVASGALFFSSAGDAGRLTAGTSGVWEGDFLDSGEAIPMSIGDLPYINPDAHVHSFNGLTGGSAAIFDELTADAPDAITLQWSDPLGGATNDYDLFLLDDMSDVVDLSIDPQECPPTCGADPFEIVAAFIPAGLIGDRIVVIKWSGEARALRLDTHTGELAIATGGATLGHNAAESVVTVAAADVITAGGGSFTGGAANPVEVYSSDGPRRLFYLPNGTPITPGNLLFATNGGRDVPKPDLTAADCVTTSTPGFDPFCGTSAAAPHAAGIAALLLSTPNSPSGGQALAAMFTTALDVDPAGLDVDSGRGIVMADAAGTALTSLPATDFYTIDACRGFDTRDGGGPTAGAPLVCGTTYDFAMTGGACGVPGTARAISVNVTVTGPTNPGNLRLFASGAPTPPISTLNYSAAQTRGNNAVAPLSSSGEMAVRCAPAGTIHVIVDLNGYFE